MLNRLRAARERRRAEDRDIETWLSSLRADPAEQRAAKDAIDRAMQVYAVVLDQHVRSGCCCTGGRVVVIHDPGTYCGDEQHERIEAVLTEQPFPSDGAAAVLDALRGTR